jgi:two-component system sensor histidine kinase/response regulator
VDLGGVRVLVVDDDDRLRKALNDILAAAGADTLTASGGAEALGIMQEDEVDVVVLDVMMPDISGFEVTEAIRTDPRHDLTPIILLTAADARSALVRGFEVGANDFVAKPAEAVEILARVSAHARGKILANRLVEISALQQRMVQAMAHDLRNAAAVAHANAHLLLNESGDPDIQESAADIATALRRISDLLDDLLLSARIRDQKLVPQRQQVEVAPFLENVLKQARPRARVAKMAVEAEVRSGAPATFAFDPDLMLRVLENIVSNALTHGASAGDAVTISADGDERTLRVSVQDRGPGVPEDKREAIFDQWFAVAGGVTSTRGTGIGLALCRDIVEAHQGRIRVEDAEPQGARFVVELPG